MILAAFLSFIIFLSGCTKGQSSMQPVARPAARPVAQPASRPSTDGDYEGIVTATDVYVRARPGLTEYVCAKVSHPTRVTVVGSRGQWLKILPVAGTFSVIRKQSVRLDATGKGGTVTDDKGWIRAGGKLHSQDFWVIQRRAKRGTKLDIIGQTGDYYKITPPSGVYFWISERYVRRESSKTVGVEPQGD